MPLLIDEVLLAYPGKITEPVSSFFENSEVWVYIAVILAAVLTLRLTAFFFNNQKIIFSDTVFTQEVDGEIVLLDMESENYFGLDEVGTAIWQVMQEYGTLQEVFNAILEQYDVEEVLKKDFSDFVEKQVHTGLVEVKAN